MQPYFPLRIKPHLHNPKEKGASSNALWVDQHSNPQNWHENLKRCQKGDTFAMGFLETWLAQKNLLGEWSHSF